MVEKKQIKEKKEKLKKVEKPKKKVFEKVEKFNKKFEKLKRKKEFAKKEKKKKRKKILYKIVSSEKKSHLAKKARQTKWAPVWVVLKKFGAGKKVHPSAITRYRRSWRRTKLHLRPRKMRKSHYG